VTLFGIGMGYLMEEMRRINPGALYIIIEPDIKLFAEILKTRDLSELLCAERTLLFIEPEHIDFDELVPHPSAENIRQFVSRPYRMLYEEKAAQAEGDFLSYMNGKRINIATLKRFDRLWTKNIFKNCPYFFTRHGLVEVKNAGTGFPAVVVAAGPSQEGTLPLLKQLQDRVIIIAVDTVATPLMKREIVPDFVVTVDPQLINSHYVAGLAESCTEAPPPVLVADPAVYPTVLRIYQGPVVLTSSVFNPGKIIERFSGHKGSIAAGGSVATAAFDLGRILDADPLFILGLDLSYGMGRTHLSGSLVETFILSHIDRFHPLLSHTAGYMRGGKAVPVRDKRGMAAFTDRRMLLYRSWFEHQMKTERRKVYNITDGGLSIKGMVDVTPSMFEEHASGAADVKRALMDRIRSRITAMCVDRKRMEDFLGYLRETEEQLRQLRDLHAHAMDQVKALLHGRQDSSSGGLDRIEAEILAYHEPNRLISMVMQAPINRVLSGRKAEDMRQALENSLELYAAMSDAAQFLIELTDMARAVIGRKTSCRSPSAH